VHVRNNAFEKAACLHSELVLLGSKLICLTESNDTQEIDAITKTLAEASERKSHLININQYEAAGAVYTEILAMEAKRAKLRTTWVKTGYGGSAWKVSRDVGGGQASK
jgi:hypothetical protein